MTLGAGSRLLLCPKFSARECIKNLKTHKATHMSYIGEIIRFINAVPEEEDDIDNNLYAIMGNGLSHTEWIKFINRFGKDIWVNEIYGASEMPSVIYAPPGHARAGAVGRLTPTLQELQGITLVEIDEETNQPIRGDDGFLIKSKPNEPGLIVMKVSEIFQFSGYHGDEAKTEEKKIHSAFEEDDLWINSGDLMIMNDEYELFFSDRLGDTYRWKGENISASQTENEILKNDYVNQCIVYGKQIENNEGRLGVAVICLEADTTEATELKIIESIASTVALNIHPAGTPRIYKIVASIPMTDTYKYKKAQVAKEDITEEDYFCDKSNQVVKFNKQLINELLNGKLNNII